MKEKHKLFPPKSNVKWSFPVKIYIKKLGRERELEKKWVLREREREREKMKERVKKRERGRV